MTIELLALPYEQNALEPHISAETIEYHYGENQKSYVEKLNNLTSSNEIKGKSLEEIVKNSTGAIFNNATQVWNHNFYWSCLSPHGDGVPKGILADANMLPLLTIDVWEHAYYIDCRNARAKYIDGYWKRVNLDFFEKNYSA